MSSRHHEAVQDVLFDDARWASPPAEEVQQAEWWIADALQGVTLEESVDEFNNIDMNTLPSILASYYLFRREAAARALEVV